MFVGGLLRGALMFGKLFQGKDGGAPRGSAVSPTMIIDTGDEPTPAFMLRATGLHRLTMVAALPETINGQDAYELRRLNPSDPHELGLLWEAFSKSVAFEKHRRGLRITDERGALLPVTFTDEEGFIVDVIANDDGSETYIIASDAEASATIGEHREWQRLSREVQCPAWVGLVAPTEQHRAWMANYGMRPLLRLKLESFHVAARVPDDPFRPPSTLHGDAQFAWIDHIAASPAVAFAADLERPVGAPLGYFSAGHFRQGDAHADYVYSRGEGHRLVVGPPGSGKFTAVIAPLMLGADDAAIVVFDVANGEAFTQTSSWRRELGVDDGRTTEVLDPFGITGAPSASVNPLDLLRTDDPYLLETAKRLADAIFIPTAGVKDSDYWDSQARDLLAALLIHVATAEPEGQRNLARLRRIIRRPIDAELIGALEQNAIAGGFLQDMAANLVAAVEAGADKNTFYVQQTLATNTAFLDLPSIQEVTATSTLDLAALRQAANTLYVVVPEHEMVTVNRWLRLIYTVIMETARGAGAAALHVILDEFPSFGRFPRVVDDMARVRKFGMHMHVIVQSLSQLKDRYGDGWEQFTGSARLLQVMGANDELTQSYVARRMGRTTARATSTSHNRGTGHGGSDGESQSWVGVDLLAPDQLGRFNPAECIVIAEATHPLRLAKLHYFEDRELAERAGLSVQS